MQRLNVEIPNAFYQKQLISCQVACPVHTDARGYVRAIAEGRFEEAYLIARGPNPFASICGRICGAPCEIACRRGKIPRVNDDGQFEGQDRPVAIRALKRFVCERFGPEVRSIDDLLKQIRDFVPPVAADAEEMAALLRAGRDGSILLANGEKIAVIGAGPAGLSAAHDLALLGFKPVVFEIEPVPAGMLAVGVPAYRLSRELIAREVSVIEALGVEIRCGVEVGRDVSFTELRKEFRAVIIAVGAKRSRTIGLPGENGPGVIGGVDLLRAVSLGEPINIGEKVVVIGGGNVAYDVARSVIRQIAIDTARTAARLRETFRVCLVSLESAEEMPADTIEIVEGDEEGIERFNGWGPIEISRNDSGNVVGVRFRKCLSVYDQEHKFAPVYDDTETLELPADTVLLAVGQAPKLSFLNDGGRDIERIRGDWLKVDCETMMTTAPGVFVAGDLAHGTRLLIDAVASGKAAARSVYQYITGHQLKQELIQSSRILYRYRRERGYEAIRRVEVPTIDPDERMKNPECLVEKGYSEAEAMREASRCLDCGVSPVFDGSRCILCGGCADVCPTECLKLVSLDRLDCNGDLGEFVHNSLGESPDFTENSAILKDEDRCIRCALCEMRCPVDAISMERVTFQINWRTVYDSKSRRETITL